MKKINAILVLLNRDSLDAALKLLNLDKINLILILTDTSTGEKTFKINENEIPRESFIKIQALAKKHKDLIWLIDGGLNNPEDIGKMKNFLIAHGVSDKNIVNLEISSPNFQTWLANFEHIKEHGADFFATGNEYVRDNLNLNHIPRVWSDTNNLGGVCLANDKQDLRQSYLIAKEVFKSVEFGSIKFVLIGLTPDSFLYDNARDFSNCSKNFLYSLAFNSCEGNVYNELLNTLLSDEIKQNFKAPAAAADLNFDNIKSVLNREFSSKSIIDYPDDTKSLTNVAADNVQILKDYIELCLQNCAQPVGVIFPFAPVIRNNYEAALMEAFRKTIHQLQKESDFICIDMFELNLNYDCFCEMKRLNKRGMNFSNTFLSMKLCENELIPVKNFCDVNYESFNFISYITPKDDYNAFMEKVFKASVEMIRCKEKIKLSFVCYNPSMWCGDDLYNLFAADKRFEVSIYFFMDPVLIKKNNEMGRTEFYNGVEKFRSHGLNVVVFDKLNPEVPPCDVYIFLTPYFFYLPKTFSPAKITAKSLITHIPYSFSISMRKQGYFNHPIFHFAWRFFFSSIIALEVYASKVSIGMPNGVYSGYPRTDIFFEKDKHFHFAWKMTRPDAKKIIWAPHWSINDITRYATFQWNYQFMYEFAKAHPEISWVVKPHPNLLFSAVNEKIFPSDAAFNEYMKMWDALPNAQVYTGAYYQDIFATSDGMIHDSGSFIAEYQFVDKPMIFLTRENEKFNKLGEEILGVSYLVDGKDLDEIAAMMQRVFIEGDDYKADERKAVFDKYLNYPQYNGMLASEFVYKNIADELKEEPK